VVLLVDVLVKRLRVHGAVTPVEEKVFEKMRSRVRLHERWVEGRKACTIKERWVEGRKA
jgi:hypothetical protein